MNPDTECGLVDRLRQGDAAAFDAIHEAFNAQLARAIEDGRSRVRVLGEVTP